MDYVGSHRGCRQQLGYASGVSKTCASTRTCQDGKRCALQRQMRALQHSGQLIRLLAGVKRRCCTKHESMASLDHKLQPALAVA